jgi:DNA mismatch repair ATPase MutL
MIHGGESARVYVGEKRRSAAAACRVRPSRVRAMLAMRACRSSIMVGTALSLAQMQAIVQRLADLDGPWNCPHGRPTLRHVHTLRPSA